MRYCKAKNSNLFIVLTAVPVDRLRMNLICFEEVKEKSSHYGLNMLGYTRATRLKTNRRKGVNLNKPIKIN